MKKFVIVCVALLLLLQIAHAADAVEVTAVPNVETAKPGEEITYLIRVENTSGQKLESVRVQFEIDSCLTYEKCESGNNFAYENYIIPKGEYTGTAGNVEDQSFTLCSVTYRTDKEVTAADAIEVISVSASRTETLWLPAVLIGTCLLVIVVVMLKRAEQASRGKRHLSSNKT